MKFYSTIGLIGVFAFSINLSAEPVSGKIKSVNQTKTKILILSKNTKGLKVGDLLNASETCELEVLSISKTKILLSTELCESRAQLEKGMTISLNMDENKEEQSLTNKATENSTSPINTTSTQYQSIANPTQNLSHGMRISLLKSFFDGKLKDDNGNQASGDVDTDFSFGIGYADINRNDIGYTTNLFITKFEESASSIRLDGNITYGFNQFVYGIGGLNINHFVDGLDADSSPSLGFQLGLGTQINRNFGLNLLYTELNNNIEGTFEDLSLKINGIELGLNATF